MNQQLFPRIVLAAGYIVSLIGLVFVGTYFWEAVISTVGESDRSLIFWYLPILFIGIAGTVIGYRLVRWGRKTLDALLPSDFEDKGNDTP